MALVLQPRGQFRGRQERGAGAGSHGQIHQAGDVTPIAPGAKVGELVGTQQPDIARALGQAAQRVDGVSGAVAFDFDGVDDQAVVPGNGQFQHVTALFAGGVQGCSLPRVAGGNELHGGEIQRVQRAFCQRDMGDVDGVKAAAQETDALQTQSRGVR
ncbi:hypothetical protein D3C71_1402990 [compost metagenome]